MRKKRWIGVLSMCGAAVAVAVAACWPAGALNTACDVSLCAVERGGVERSLEVGGVVRGAEEFAALYPASGLVAQVYVRPGDRVKKGQALFRMESSAQEETVSSLLAAGSAVDEEVSAVARLLDTGTVANEGMSAVTRLLDTPAASGYGSLAGKISLEDAIRQLEAMTARAPADGVVRQVVAARYGGGVAGDAAVMLSSEESRIVCEVAACDAQQVREGMEARISAEGEALVTAHVTAIGAAYASALTGRQVKQVTLSPDEALGLPPGTQVDVTLIMQCVRDAPVLPVTAVTASGTVWWVSGERAWETPVQVLMQDERACWVDLQEGVTVVDCPQNLVSGQLVKGVME